MDQDQAARRERILREIRERFAQDLRKAQLKRISVEFPDDRIVVQLFRRGEADARFTFNLEGEDQLLDNIGAILPHLIRNNHNNQPRR